MLHKPARTRKETNTSKVGVTWSDVYKESPKKLVKRTATTVTLHDILKRLEMYMSEWRKKRKYACNSKYSNRRESFFLFQLHYLKVEVWEREKEKWSKRRENLKTLSTSDRRTHKVFLFSLLLFSFSFQFFHLGLQKANIYFKWLCVCIHTHKMYKYT